jgi:hypothetical protein
MHRNLIKHLGTLFLVFSLLLNPKYVNPVYALNAPDLIGPADGTTTTAANTPPLAMPEFKWAAVAGATKYRLQVSNNIAFTTLTLNILTSNTTYTPSSVTSFSDGVWFWRVRVDAPTPVSEYSTIWTFTKSWAAPGNAPTLNSPANGTTLAFFEQTVFSWGSVMGAAKYKLQIYSSPGGWANTAYNVTTLATTHQPAIKLTNGVYYWRVVPVDTGNHDGTPSVERSFTAGYNFVPSLLEPAIGANPTFTPTFRWTAVRGAQFYRLEYTTDSTFSSGITRVDTRNTSHTPTTTLPNDVNYYWRVRAQSGNSISAWSPTRSFLKKWYIKPVLLTPTNLYQHVRFPIFSWTPVPGASYYRVEISTDVNFSSFYDSGITANTFYTPSRYDGGQSTFYWRVKPFDGNGEDGVFSNTSSYVSYFDSLAPQQVYPFYYYPPDTYSGFPGITTNPHEDRTVPLPIFVWHRVYVPAQYPNEGEVYADAYRLEVSTDATFSSVNWTVDTENTTATPTLSNSFTPSANIDYYWRVRPLIGGNEAGQWSQIWKTRFDSSQGLTPTGGSAPVLIRPADAFEYAESTPLLEWFPLNGANTYDVQISRDSGFTDIVDSASVSNSAYVPTQALAQRSLGSLNFGIYYWHVRQSPNGTWSETRRFQIAAQSQWQSVRTLGDTTNRLQIGSDPASDIVSADYDLTSLQIAQSKDFWYFGFDVPSSPSQNVTYALYLDLDYQANSGATFDARNYSVTTISTYRPEYAIYVLQQSGAYTASKVYIYRWNGIGWDTVSVLSNIGGQLIKNGNYVELEVPNTAIGYQDTTGSYTVSLFSVVDAAGQPPQDSVPSDPNVPGSGVISRFANVTERMNPLMPPSSVGVDTVAYPSYPSYPSIQPFFWDWPVLSPWAGANMKAYLDPQFTTEAASYTLTSNTPYYAQTSHSWGNDFGGDNTYYWRIQPRYLAGTLGAWSQGWRFERKGFVAKNLQTSVTFATPTFSWDMVEGAESYELQVSTDPAFGSTAISVTTRQNSYTDIGTLANGSYYWRVRVHRYNNVTNNWTPNQNFTLALPTPSGLTPLDVPDVPNIPVVSQAPTLCWTPLIASSSGTAVLAAWKYRVQVSKDQTFSVVFDSIDTEQSCWTPTKGYDDGQYYWHVAMIDGSNKFGNYGAYKRFIKQYPTTTLVSPNSGATLLSTPTFVWTAVNRAAKYKLEVSQSPNFSPLYDTITTDSIRWTPTKIYSNLGTYYWRVAIVDADGKVGPYVGSTIILSDGKVPISLYLGTSSNPIDSFSLGVGQSLRKSYNQNSGPVRITSSTGNILASQRVLFGGLSYSEMIGLPNDQLTTEYLFPYYNNVAMDSQLRVSNLGSVTTTITVLLGTQQIDSYQLAGGAATKKNYSGKNGGPLRVTSSSTNILSTIRVLYGGNSYSEIMGYPSNQLTTEYLFPYYNNVAMDSQLRVSNLGNVPTTITVYLGTQQIDSYSLGAGGAVRKNYSGKNGGPLKVTSSATNILTTIRVLFSGSSYSEMMGYPSDNLAQEYWYPVYDNSTLDSQLRVSNVGSGITTITVYAGSTQIDSYTLGAGGASRKNYPQNTGPLHVVSDPEPILSTIRMLYTTPGFSSYYEMMGLPNTQLSTQYFFPWYNNVAMNSELRFAVP